MNFFSRIVSQFKKPDISKRISIFCSNSYQAINESEASLLMIELVSNCQAGIQQTIHLLNIGSSIGRLKFASMVLLNEETCGVLEKIESGKRRLLRDCKQPSVIESETQMVCNQIMFYLMKSIKRSYKERAKKGSNESTITMNRMYINYAYKFLNQLNYLLILQPNFNHLFQRYTNITFIQQSYLLISKQINQLYQCFKQSINYYFTGFDRQQVLQNIQQIKQLINTNNQVYKKMKQFFCLGDYISNTRKQRQKNKDTLVPYAQIPHSIQKWFSKISKSMTQKITLSQIQSMPSLSNICTVNTLSQIV